MAATAQNHMEPLRSDGKKEEDFEEERELEMSHMIDRTRLNSRRISRVSQFIKKIFVVEQIYLLVGGFPLPFGLL